MNQSGFAINKGIFSCLFFGVSALAFAGVLPLTESTVTEVFKDVKVVGAVTKAAASAKLNEQVKAPDLVRTGPGSRTELTAPDETITRIGASTVFSFDSDGRSINLERGSVLFHSPAGKGGGSIKAGGASAAVLGTTIICVVMQDHSFKTIVAEGNGKVTLRDGRFIELKEGEMCVVSPDGESYVLKEVDLRKIVPRLLLVSGFTHPLSSLPLIEAAIERQHAGMNGDSSGELLSSPFVTAELDLLDDGLAGHSNNPPKHEIIFMSPVLSGH